MNARANDPISIYVKMKCAYVRGAGRSRAQRGTILFPVKIEFCTNNVPDVKYNVCYLVFYNNNFLD